MIQASASRHRADDNQGVAETEFLDRGSQTGSPQHRPSRAPIPAMATASSIKFIPTAVLSERLSFTFVAAPAKTNF